MPKEFGPKRPQERRQKSKLMAMPFDRALEVALPVLRRKVLGVASDQRCLLAFAQVRVVCVCV